MSELHASKYQCRMILDCIGLALLCHFGAGSPLNRGSIFEQEQLKQAAELGLGVQSTKEIRLLADDKESRAMVNILEALLSENYLYIIEPEVTGKHLILMFVYISRGCIYYFK